MVKIEHGNIFNSDAQTLVNTINCAGVMGKGLALEFKNRYPAMFDKYKSFCDKGVFKPGVLWIYKADDGKWILNFPTKVDWKDPSQMSYIEEGLKKFAEIWKDKGITSVAFPLLGCGEGGLDPDEIIPLIEKYLEQCDGLDATVYDDRIPKIEEAPVTDATSDFFEDESPREIVIESEPLTEEEPPKVTDETPEKENVQLEAVSENETIQPEAEPEAESKYGTKDIQSEFRGNDELKPDFQQENMNEDYEILKEIVEERKAIHNEVDKILEDFSKGDNSPEYRKKIAKKIVNVINRRGFPAGSIFQI